MSRKIPLPRGWNRRVKSVILQILALSHEAAIATLFGVTDAFGVASSWEETDDPASDSTPIEGVKNRWTGTPQSGR